MFSVLSEVKFFLGIHLKKGEIKLIPLFIQLNLRKFVSTKDAFSMAKFNHPGDQTNNKLHGVKLEDMLNYLVEEYGWEELGNRININCFTSNPSVRSSLKFLRRTAWARNKVEKLYIDTVS